MFKIFQNIHNYARQLPRGEYLKIPLIRKDGISAISATPCDWFYKKSSRFLYRYLFWYCWRAKQDRTRQRSCAQFRRRQRFLSYHECGQVISSADSGIEIAACLILQSRAATRIHIAASRAAGNFHGILTQASQEDNQRVRRGCNRTV